MEFKVFLVLLSCAFGIYAYKGDIIAYDCVDPNVELSKVSLLGVERCLDPRNSSKEESKQIKLIQQRKYIQVHVYSCLVQVEQLVQHCGMFSHVSAVDEGYMSYIHKIGSDECKRIHLDRNKMLGFHKLKNGLSVKVQSNTSTHSSATLVGTLNHKGDCNGVKYSYNGVDYEDVIITAQITIKLRDYVTVAAIEENSLKLRNGATCPYSDHYCFDDEAGEVTWDIIDTSDRCSKNNYDILYEGPATLLTLMGSNSKYIVVEHNDIIFALSLRSQENICSNQVWRTEQSRLGVIYDSNPYRRTQQVIPQNIDIMDQVLSKLLYLEIAIKTRSRDLMYDSIKKRCELRKNILRNRLALAYSSPDVVSGFVKEASGHMGRVVGEALYIIRCVPKLVKYRQTKECYQELPIITYENKKKFMAPITHIIEDYGTQINCDKKMPPLFYLGGSWMQFTPYMQMSPSEPFILNPNDPNETLTPVKIMPIDSNGIYSKEEMENFKHTLLFPNERDTISNIVARRIIGAEAESQGFKFPNIFSKIEFGAMARGAAKLIWGVFAGLVSYIPTIGISILVLALVKYLIEVIINYLFLKGNSNASPFKIMGASLWNMFTNMLLYRSAQKTQAKPTEENITLNSSSSNSNKPLLTRSSECNEMI